MEEIITANLRGFELKLKVRPGVFSKKKVDVGSTLLIEHLEIEDGIMIADLGCGGGRYWFCGSQT